MKYFNIVEKKENKLFNRIEYIIEIESEVVPSHKDTEEVLTKELKTQIENIKIRKIESKFGSRTFKIIADIYKTKEDKEKTVQKTKQEKQAEIKSLEDAKKAQEEAEKAKQEAETTKPEAEIKEPIEPPKEQTNEAIA